MYVLYIVTRGKESVCPFCPSLPKCPCIIFGHQWLPAGVACTLHRASSCNDEWCAHHGEQILVAGCEKGFIPNWGNKTKGGLPKHAKTVTQDTGAANRSEERRV